MEDDYDMGDMQHQKGIGDSGSMDEEHNQPVCPSAILYCCTVAIGKIGLNTVRSGLGRRIRTLGVRFCPKRPGP
jgi:hypothetical protein